MVKRADATATHFGGVHAPTAEPQPPAAVPAETGQAPTHDAGAEPIAPPAVLGVIATPSPKILAQVKALEAELANIIQRYEITIPAAMDNARARLAEAQKSLGMVAERVEAKREQRQHLLAVGCEVESLNREIEEIRREKEIAEDLAKGLESLIPTLERESSRLQTEDRPRLDSQLFDLKVTPLVDAYNDTAARLAAITEDLHQLAMAHRQSMSPNSVVLVWPSSWEAFRTVPRLCRPGAVGGNFFEYNHFMYRIQQEMKAAAQA